ncbi:MAG: 3-oxoacyl-ACP reductase FabG [Methylobacter sp.]|uniref:3-oxoacyl-ACP reductase FabG n=1 Tax=Candidatus Methylobacter titanis TaxID=3053457 RepID=A0AA43Q743_9GAMM|nr:3-oxoacyl-ACP reductase FabG [Candidatus Methylobacter titanis]
MNHEVAFVTGASRGIGKAIAEELIKAQYKVAVGYNSHKELAELVANGFSSAMAVHVDISDEGSIDQAIKCTEERFGEVDILVNNAGIAQQKPFLELTDADWQQMMSVNLLGAVRCTRRVLPAMIGKKYGRIINISSIGGQWGGVYQVHYAASKAGLINLTMSMARLYSQEGITCNVIAPGLIETDMIAEEMNDAAAYKRIEAIPSARLGSVQEVAAVAIFLASKEASYITGQTINVNGGMYFG